MASKKRRKRKRRKSSRSTAGRKFLLAALLVVLLAGGFIAWVATRPETGEQQQAVCTLVIDRTSSFQDKTIDARHRAMASAAVDGCRKRNARLSVFYFDQSTQKLVALSDKNGDGEFALWLPKGQKASVQQNQLDATIENAKQAVDSAFDKGSGDARGSDIVTAVQAATVDLNTRAREDGVKSRYLIVLSDGLQTSEGLSVQDLATPEAPVQPLVDRVGSLGLTPKLDGVSVNFIGVRSGVAGDGSQLPQFFEAKVQDFWTGVVKAGGGSLCQYVPDATQIPTDC